MIGLYTEIEKWLIRLFPHKGFFLSRYRVVFWGFPGGSVVKSHLPMQEMRETRVRSLGQEDPLEKEMVTRSNITAREIPWTEEPSGLQSMGPQRVGHDWAHTHADTVDFSIFTELGYHHSLSMLVFSYSLCIMDTSALSDVWTFLSTQKETMYHWAIIAPPSRTFHTHGLMQNVNFCICFFFAQHDVFKFHPCGSKPSAHHFFLLPNNSSLCVFIVCLSVSVHLDCFYFWVTKSDAPMNICVPDLV